MKPLRVMHHEQHRIHQQRVQVRPPESASSWVESTVTTTTESSRRRRKSFLPKSAFPFKQKATTNTKVLKNLQKVCDKEAQRLPAVQSFLLYCPFTSDKRVDISHWHIQIVPARETIDSSSFLDAMNDIPSSISVPSSSRSADTGVSSRSYESSSSEDVLYAALSTTTRPLVPILFEEDILQPRTNVPYRGRPRLCPLVFETSRHQNPNQAASTHLRPSVAPSRSQPTPESSPRQQPTLTNPFEDDPSDGLAMSRDGLLELDRVLDSAWMSAPSTFVVTARPPPWVPIPPPTDHS